jgi:hypothetical protein
VYAIRIDRRGFRTLAAGELTGFYSTARSHATKGRHQWRRLIGDVEELFDWQPLPP